MDPILKFVKEFSSITCSIFFNQKEWSNYINNSKITTIRDIDVLGIVVFLGEYKSTFTSFKEINLIYVTIFKEYFFILTN